MKTRTDEIGKRLDSIVRALSSIRIPAAPEEAELHAMVESALTSAGLSVIHEARLGRGSRIDFVCDGVGIEVKKGKVAPSAMRRQLERYAASDDIRALILVAPGALRVPDVIDGKPVRVLPLSRLWGIALP